MVITLSEGGLVDKVISGVLGQHRCPSARPSPQLGIVALCRLLAEDSIRVDLYVSQLGESTWGVAGRVLRCQASSRGGCESVHTRSGARLRGLRPDATKCGLASDLFVETPRNPTCFSGSPDLVASRCVTPRPGRISRYLATRQTAKAINVRLRRSLYAIGHFAHKCSPVMLAVSMKPLTPDSVTTPVTNGYDRRAENGLL